MIKTETKNSIIDANKVRLAEFLSTPRAFRPMTLKEFAGNLGVSEPTIHNWKKDPEVVRLTMSKITENFFVHVPEVVNALKDRAVAGDVSAAKLFLDYVAGKEFCIDSGGKNQEHQNEATREEVRGVIEKIKNKNV